MELDTAKEIIEELWGAVAGGDVATLRSTADRVIDADAVWHLSAPFDAKVGASGTEALEPMVESLALQGLDWHVLVSQRAGDGETYVSGTGYLFGHHRARWLGIAASDAPAALRFGAIHRVQVGRVTASWVLLDVLDFAHRAGVPNLPGRYDRGLVPATSLVEADIPDSDREEDAVRTRELVEQMIAGLMAFDGHDLASMAMPRYWHSSMDWYGPGAIGTTTGLRGFEDLHQRPFLASFPDRRGGDHVARIADGFHFASGGWPSVRAHHRGAPYLGVPATGAEVGMRVMDWWRREGDLLAENWVLIDIPHLLEQLGHPLFTNGELTPSGVHHG